MRKRADECFACKSRSCHRRIFNTGAGYDEIACEQHGADLEKHADAYLRGQPRVNIGSSEKLKRESGVL